MINAHGKNIREIAESLIAIDGVTEVYPIAGEYDFIAVVRVHDNEAMSRIITEELIYKEGIRHTKTLFALDSYSKIDLAEAFGN